MHLSTFLNFSLNIIYIIFSVTLILNYDSLFLNNVCGGNHQCAMEKVQMMIAIAQTYFLKTNILGMKIDLKVIEVRNTDGNFRLRKSGACDPQCTL